MSTQTTIVNTRAIIKSLGGVEAVSKLLTDAGVPTEPSVVKNWILRSSISTERLAIIFAVQKEKGTPLDLNNFLTTREDAIKDELAERQEKLDKKAVEEAQALVDRQKRRKEREEARVAKAFETKKPKAPVTPETPAPTPAPTPEPTPAPAPKAPETPKAEPVKAPAPAPAVKKPAAPTKQ